MKLPAAAPDARPGSWRKHFVRAAIRSPGKRSATGGITSTAEREVAPCTASEQEEDILACAEANDKKYRY
ncbi:hypothetical protein LNP24_18640 [Klebsiella pneumoniae subsp. pneumoniae]|nr:hypothetical protein [Klebsiella pneumoniae subsp. pneumoniae]